MTRDHKPNLPEERARIELSGGVVRTMNLDNSVRVFVKDRYYPGLSMSRALGDQLSAEIGVSCEPEITTYDITDVDRFLIIASDGVWEFMTNEDVVDEVATSLQTHTVQETADRLGTIAWNRWKAKEHNVVDDITVVIYLLGPREVENDVSEENK
jgi:serine/threonine protein phosphatase PrpC